MVSGAGQTIPHGDTPDGGGWREMVEMVVVFNILEDGGLIILVHFIDHSYVKERKS